MELMKERPVELLEISNFLSITKIKWEVGQFNIITGDMGTGKSLCIKLLQFFEDIIPDLLVLPYEVFMDNLNSDKLFNSLIESFKNIFVFTTSDSKTLPCFRIDYTFSYREEIFNMSIIDNEENDIVFESPSLEKLLAEWHDFVNKRTTENLTPDGFKEIKLSLYNDLLTKFGNYFPMATIFVPASRAALAFASIHDDYYLNDYKRLVDFLPRYKSNYKEMVKTILKAEINITDKIYLESDDGRQVPIGNASSGQQEIAYVLLLLDKLGSFHYTYGKYHSVFIEEPSAHLFPLEQKQVIDLIVKVFNTLKGNGNPIRFFITTHSPYVLNVVNNLMRKGSIIKQYQDQSEKINKEIEFPSLFMDDVSAIFINDDGTITDMIDYEEEQIIPAKIRDISFSINDDIDRLDKLYDELNTPGGKVD